MKTIEMKLNIHTPWYQFPKNDSTDSFDSFMRHMKAINNFQCGDLCHIGISNKGDVIIRFYEEQSESEIRELTAIMLYFISICNGFNCQYEECVIVDGVTIPKFFNYAKEDDCGCTLYKDIKFYQISLVQIENVFGDILYRLFTMDRRLCLALLANYYSMVVYKDFIGNGEYKFRNIVTNIESLMALIYEKKYNEIKGKNKEFMQQISKMSDISITKLNKYVLPKSVILEDKLKDAFDYFKNDGLIFKGKIKKECSKIANTRNFISHLFESNIEYLTQSEISKYSAVFEELFRMIFLEFVGIDRQLIINNFLISEPIKITLQQVFRIANNR